MAGVSCASRAAARFMIETPFARCYYDSMGATPVWIRTMSKIDLKIKSRDLNALLSAIEANNPQGDLGLIRRAYEYASDAHKDQKRLSGEPYIVHPLEIGIILANLKMDTTTIAAALLHDVVEDTPVSLEIVRDKFGEEIALLVDGVTKISSLKKKTRYNDQVHSIRKMLMATIKDVRVILIKLADKVHNMRTIMFQPEQKQVRIAHEVMDIYAPMAGRLGMSQIRAELEDMAFHVLYPEEYEEISGKVARRKTEIGEFIEDLRFILDQQLRRLDIEAEITGRAKHFYSIYRKMKLQGKSFEDIFDIRAIRIITSEVRDCYGILGVIHTMWSPITSRFKDYIAVPKSNMYQSLHTTVIGPDGLPLEFQIRTRDMHATAEMGIAAHWLYKDRESVNQRAFKNLPILQNIPRADKEQGEKVNSREFMRELKMDLYEDEIFVFTPRGKIVKLAKGATPIDFAYAIHTEVGNRCVGAKVNNALVPLKTEIKSGDIVEILTSPKGHPSESWLKIVKSANARYKIRNWLRREQEAERRPEAQAEHKKPEKTAEVSIPETELFKIKGISRQKKTALSIDGTSNVLTKLSQCCQPIPGDDVVGFITRGRGITVHKKNCPSLKRLKIEKERFIEIVWEGSENTYPVKLQIEAIDRTNLLKDVADELAVSKANIIKVEATVHAGDNAVIKLVLEVKSLAHLKDIIARLKRLKNITSIQKLNEKVLLK